MTIAGKNSQQRKWLEEIFHKLSQTICLFPFVHKIYISQIIKEQHLRFHSFSLNLYCFLCKVLFQRRRNSYALVFQCSCSSCSVTHVLGSSIVAWTQARENANYFCSNVRTSLQIAGKVVQCCSCLYFNLSMQREILFFPL